MISKDNWRKYIDKLAANKARLVLLNKADMADPEKSKEWMQFFEQKGIPVCVLDSRNKKDMKQITQVVQQACAAKFERDRKRGLMLGNPPSLIHMPEKQLPRLVINLE